MAQNSVLVNEKTESIVYLQTKELTKNKNKSYFILKRLFDIIFSFIALVVLSPFFLVISIFIIIDSRGSAIYSQPRVGRNGKIFTMYKFRSMCKDADKMLKELQDLNEKDGPIFKISDDPRLTKVGRILRKTSLDELPQLLNILKGNMSFVGPRPPLINEVNEYTPHQMQRLSVVPGLTCYWQINGRSDVSFEEWVDMDLDYIRDSSLRTDLKIILKTFPAVFLGRGAY